MNFMKLAAIAGLVTLLSACSNVSAYRIGEPRDLLVEPGEAGEAGDFGGPGGGSGPSRGGGSTGPSGPPSNA